MIVEPDTGFLITGNEIKEKPKRKKKLIKLDIACGQNKNKGFKGIDIAPLPKVDIVHNLEVYPWPLKDESVGQAVCSHYVEHVPDLCAFMNELYRILAPEGFCIITCPYYTSVRAFQDPTHVRFISEASFLYFNKEWREENKLDHYPINCDFDFSYGYCYYAEWETRSDDARQYAVQHYWNVVSDIQVFLKKK